MKAVRRDAAVFNEVGIRQIREIVPLVSDVPVEKGDLIVGRRLDRPARAKILREASRRARTGCALVFLQPQD
jgi:hypothetical protein